MAQQFLDAPGGPVWHARRKGWKAGTAVKLADDCVTDADEPTPVVFDIEDLAADDWEVVP